MRGKETLKVEYLIGILAVMLIVPASLHTPEIKEKRTTTPSNAVDVLGEQSLEVRESIGEPQPLNFDLQGSLNTDQQAQGSLQTPQTGALQPNAGPDSLEKELE